MIPTEITDYLAVYSTPLTTVENVGQGIILKNVKLLNKMMPFWISGPPFGPFWDGLDIDFDDDVVYHFDHSERMVWENE